MKPLLFSTLLPATAIALGSTALMHQPSYAASEPYAINATALESGYDTTRSDGACGDDAGQTAYAIQVSDQADVSGDQAGAEHDLDDPESESFVSQRDRDYRIQPGSNRAYRVQVPASHYAYYAIARPEYLL